MGRRGTANWRHSSEHAQPRLWNAFWEEGINREAATHPYHPWFLNKIPQPTYAGTISTTSGDAQISCWALKNRAHDLGPYCGKSLQHSPRFSWPYNHPQLVAHRAKTRPEEISDESKQKYGLISARSDLPPMSARDRQTFVYLPCADPDLDTKKLFNTARGHSMPPFSRRH